MYTFTRDTKLFTLDKKTGTSRLFNNLSALTFSQTFVDKEVNRKTIQLQQGLRDVVVNEKSRVSLSFSFYPTLDSLDELEAFSWFGATISGKEAIIDTNTSTTNLRDVLVYTARRNPQGKLIPTGIGLKITDVVLSDIEYNVSPAGLLQYNVTAEGTLLQELLPSDIPNIYDLTKMGGVPRPGGSSLKVLDTTINSGILNYSVRFAREVKALGQKTIHSVWDNGVYSASKTVASGCSISGNIELIAKTYHFNRDTGALSLIYPNAVTTTISKASILESLGNSNIYTYNTNYKAINGSTIKIVFGGL